MGMGGRFSHQDPAEKNQGKDCVAELEKNV